MALSDRAEAAVAALKRRGLRASASRRMIIQILREAASPLSAREISQGPDGVSIGLDLASVYRNLEILEEHELVHQIHAGPGPGRFLLAGTAEQEYLACERCGSTVEIDPDELDGLRALIRERYGYDVAFRNVPMMGVCQRCLASPSGR